jgi:flavin reductase (DIM6/NTAB) family NADH-FMN oxidoreductase RutF
MADNNDENHRDRSNTEKHTGTTRTTAPRISRASRPHPPYAWRTFVIDAEEFRKALRSFTTGVTVITVEKEDGMHGMTASSFASVSVDPQLVLFCIAKTARAHRFLQNADRYCINLLRESQAFLANYFAGRMTERIEPDYRMVDGCPILNESMGYFLCHKWAEYDGGDHTIFVGKVFALARTDEKPLVCSRGRFHELGARLLGPQP